MSPPDELTTFSRRHGKRTWRRAGRVAINRSKEILDLWETTCLICGEPFTITVRRNVSIANTRAFRTITCPTHRLTRSETSQLTSHNWRKIFKEIRKAKLAK